MNKLPRILAFATSGLCVLPLHSAFSAEKASTQLEEIVVTAMRRAEGLQDVPLSVSAVSADQLAAMGVDLTNELSSIAPNININSQYGDTQPNFTIRGVGVANEFNVNAASPVGVYVDDVYKSFRFTHGQALFDLERVEALRGPQGTLFGRNTTGGAINLITKKPALDGSDGYVTASAGNYRLLKTAGAVETTLIDDVLGLRIAGTRNTRDGYFDNVATNNSFTRDDYQSADSNALRATLRYRPSDKLDMVVSAHYGEDKPVGPARFSFGIVPDGAGGYTDFAGYSRFSDPLVKSDDDFNMGDMGHFATRSSGATFTVAYNVSEQLSFTSVTGYTDGSYHLEDESDGGPLQLVGIDYQSETKDFSQDFRLNYDTDSINLVAGFYYGFDELQSRNQLNFFGFFPDASSALDFNGGGLDPTRPATSFRAYQKYGQERESTAVYGEISYALTQRLDVTFGLRYTEDEIEYVDGESVVWSNFQTGEPLFPLFTGVNRQDSSEEVSGRVIFNYAVSDSTNSYIGFSRGQRSGTYNGFAYQSPDQVFFVPPEELDAIEFGVKSRLLDNSLQVNLAVFDYDYKGQQVQEIKGIVGFLTSVDADVRGAEIEMVYRPLASLTIHSSVGRLDTEYASGSLISGVDISGNSLPFAPETTATLGFDLTLARLDFAELLLNVDAQYSDQVWYDIFNDDQPLPAFIPGATRQTELKEDAYTLINARLSLVSESYSISLWGKNITDKEYRPAGYNVEGGTGMDFLVLGTPRTYGLEATYRF